MHHSIGIRFFLGTLLVALGSGRACAQLESTDHVFAEPGISVVTYIDRLKHGTTDWQRYNAAAALGELGDKSAIPALIEALGSPSEYVRENAVSSLGDLGATKAIPSIKKLLRDPSSDVRVNAANSLAQLDAVDSIADIASLFNDASPQVRASARGAVKYLEVRKK